VVVKYKITPEEIAYKKKEEKKEEKKKYMREYKCLSSCDYIC
jgi:hypothetical protein